MTRHELTHKAAKRPATIWSVIKKLIPKPKRDGALMIGTVKEKTVIRQTKTETIQEMESSRAGVFFKFKDEK